MTRFLHDYNICKTTSHSYAGAVRSAGQRGDAWTVPPERAESLRAILYRSAARFSRMILWRKQKGQEEGNNGTTGQWGEYHNLFFPKVQSHCTTLTASVMIFGKRWSLWWETETKCPAIYSNRQINDRVHFEGNCAYRNAKSRHRITPLAADCIYGASKNHPVSTVLA